MNRAIMGRPKKTQPDTEKKVVGFQVSLAYDAWLVELAKHYRTTVAGVIDRALEEWTEADGYPIKPPNRTP